MADERDDKYWEEYESGPYCKHWMESWECEEICKTCGHQCGRHDAFDSECYEDDCGCKEFIDSDNKESDHGN